MRKKGWGMGRTRKSVCGVLFSVILICGLFSGINVKAWEISDSSISSDGVIELRTESISLNEGDEIKVDLYLHNVKVQAYVGWFFWNSSEFSLVNPVETNNFVAKTFTDEEGTQVAWQKTFEEDAVFKDAIGMETYDKCYYLYLMGTVMQGYSFPEGGYIGSLYLRAEKTMEEAEIVLSCGDLYADDVEKTYGEEDDIELISLKLINQDEEDVSFHAENIEKGAGEKFTVPITLNENPGFNALGMTVKYDKNLCTYQAMEISDTFAGDIALDSVYEVPDSNEIRASFIAAGDIALTGDFIDLSFKVNEDAQAGSQGEITMEVTQLTNAAEKDLVSKGAKALLTVAAPTPVYTKGDVNEDGKINLTDAVYILMYYNDVKILTDAQLLAADTDENGEVNLLDALRIMRFYNGEIFEL